MQQLIMHVAKSLDEAIALGTSVGCMSEVQRKMRIQLSNYIKRKFLDAMIAAGDKPMGPDDLGELLSDILNIKK